MGCAYPAMLHASVTSLEVMVSQALSILRIDAIPYRWQMQLDMMEVDGMEG